jgi:hypothetical protein
MPQNTEGLTSCRSDALRRHEQVHKEPKRSTLGKGVRACLACAKARRKCSGENPCSACEKRSTECSYPRPSDVRGKTGGKGVDRASMASSDERPSELPHEEVLKANRVMASPRGSFESWSNTSHSPGPLDRNHDEITMSASESRYETNRNVITAAPIRKETFQNLGHDNPQGAVRSPICPGSHTAILGRPRSIAAAAPLQSFLGDSMMDFQQETGSEVSQTWPSAGSAPQTISVDTNTELSRASEPNFWSHNSLSSINWLPDNWIPEFNFSSGGPPSHNSYSSPAQASQDRSEGVSNITSTPSHFNEDTPLPNSHHGLTSSENSEGQGVGYYYVDGDGARLPRIRKALYRSPHQSSDPYTPFPGVEGMQYTHATFGFPRTDYGGQDVASISSKQVPIETYSEILHVFSQSCVTSSYFSPFHTADFPSLESFALFVRLYIEHFQPTLPFIHPATLNLSSTHWLLTLAIAAIGSHYVDVEDVEILSIAMHEFLRRAISMAVSSHESALNNPTWIVTNPQLETGNNSWPEGLVFTQVRLLSCIGMMYSGDQRLVEKAKASSSDLIAFCGSEWTKYAEQDDQSVRSRGTNQAASEWEAWCYAESHRRTGYSIWVCINI